MLLVGLMATFFGYTLLLPVVPLWAIKQGGSEFVAGAVTGVFMASTVLTQLTVPKLVRHRGYRPVIVTGAILIGAPSPVLLLATSWQGILAVSLVRGVGFGLVTVCGSALIAELLPRGSLARGSALYGIAVGTPQLVGLAAGTLLAGSWGFGPVFSLAAALPLAGIVALASLPKTHPHHQERVRLARTAESNWKPCLVMLSGSVGFGSLVTFLPIVLADSPFAASAALFAATGAGLLSRWVSGSLGDRSVAPGRMLPVALLTCMVGLAGFSAATAAHTALLAVLVVAVFGLGFGVVQNDSLVAMFANSPAGPASVAWNVAFDAGTGLGATVVGAVVAGTSYPVAFALLAGFALVLLPVALRARSHPSH